MRTRDREVILGAIVFAAALIVVGGSMWLSERYAGAAGGYQIVADFDTVLGLKRGDKVTIRGVKVGKVLGVDLEGGRPAVRIGLERDKVKVLPRDSRFLLRSEGLLGELMVEIQIGSGPEVLEDGARVPGDAGGSIEGMTTNVAGMARRLKEAVDDLASPTNLERIERILIRVDSTTVELRDLLAENRSALSGALDSLSMASADARQVVSENRERVRRSVENIRATTARMDSASRTLEESAAFLRDTLDNLRVVTRKMRDGEGTLGRLLHDDEAYRQAQATLASMDSLLTDVRRNPGRYFKFSLF